MPKKNYARRKTQGIHSLMMRRLEKLTHIVTSPLHSTLIPFSFVPAIIPSLLNDVHLFVSYGSHISTKYPSASLTLVQESSHIKTVMDFMFHVCFKILDSFQPNLNLIADNFLHYMVRHGKVTRTRGTSQQHMRCSRYLSLHITATSSKFWAKNTRAMPRSPDHGDRAWRSEKTLLHHVLRKIHFSNALFLSQYGLVTWC